MQVEEIRAKRKAAGERLLVAWGIAIVPNTLAAFGVDLAGVGWYKVGPALAPSGWRRSSSGSYGSGASENPDGRSARQLPEPAERVTAWWRARRP
jgi:hypothetical protein